jgi:hypothetical protein
MKERDCWEDQGIYMERYQNGYGKIQDGRCGFDPSGLGQG